MSLKENKIPQLPSLSMSNMTALKLILDNYSQESEESINIFNFIRETNPSMAHLDWNGAEKWAEILDLTKLQADLEIICRDASLAFINNSPLLFNLVLQGREKLLLNLTPDEIQVFRNGGLLEKIPREEVVLWWDIIRLKGRTILNHDLLIQGREAERWTVEFEIKKVSPLGERYFPVWVSLDSDYYGYDILSYRANPGFEPLAVLIEVKSFANPSQPQFYITRNEWNKAVETGSNYIFFIWCTTTKTHKVYSHKEIEIHIPQDTDAGKWQNALITLTDWK